jgi:hypothetical protein
MHHVCSKNKLLCRVKHRHHSSGYFWSSRTYLHTASFKMYQCATLLLENSRSKIMYYLQNGTHLTLEMNKKCTDGLPVRTRDTIPEFMITFHNLIPGQTLIWSKQTYNILHAVYLLH